MLIAGSSAPTLAQTALTYPIVNTAQMHCYNNTQQIVCPASGAAFFLTPFIDTRYFDFTYGDTANGERTINSQYASSNVNVYNSSDSGYTQLFDVNLADGRVKGYDTTLPANSTKTFFVQCGRATE